MGFRTAAIARGKDKEPLARQLGAAHYIDSQAADPAAELAKLGGAKVVLATVTHGPAMSATVGGLAPRGRLMVLGVFLRKSQTSHSKLSARGVNSNRADFETESKVRGRDSVRKLSQTIGF